MAAKKRDAEAWWTEAEASSASGGHISPTDSSAGLIDAVGTTEPDVERTPVRDGDDGVDARDERTEVIPHGVLTPAEGESASAPARGGRRRTRVSTRRVRRHLRHVDPLSVFKLSLFFYGCLLVLWLVVVAIAYALLSTTGFFELIESFGRDTLWGRFDITLALVERWALVIGLTLTILGALVNVFLAFLYNLSADVIGGIETTFVERDL